MSDIPAGWQPDPRGRHEYRYWDGTQWTDHVSDQGTVSQDPVADATPAAAAAPATEVQETATPAASADESAASPVVPPAAEAEVTASEPEPAQAEPTPEPVQADPEPAQAEPVAAGPVEPAAEAAPRPAEPVVEPQPVVAGAPAASSAPPGSSPATAQTDAKAAAQDMLHSKSPELGTILSVIAPGSGHFYMGASNAVPIGVGLLVGTAVAVVLAYMSFLFFVVGFVIWAGAAAFALTDLRGGVKGIENVSLPRNVVGILMIAAGALLVLSLFLPYYHIKVSGGGFSASKNGSGFQVFGIIDIVLLVIGIASVVAGAASLGLGPVTSAELPKQLPLAVAIGGAVAVVLLVFRLFVDSAPGFGSVGGVSVKIGRAPGILLALDCALVLLIANAGILRSAANR